MQTELAPFLPSTSFSRATISLIANLAGQLAPKVGRPAKLSSVPAIKLEPVKAHWADKTDCNAPNWHLQTGTNSRLGARPNLRPACSTDSPNEGFPTKTVRLSVGSASARRRWCGADPPASEACRPPSQLGPEPRGRLGPNGAKNVAEWAPN